MRTLDAVGEVGGAEQRRRGDDHDAELHRRADRLLQLDAIPQHQDHPVAARGAERAELGGRALVVLAVAQEQVARGAEPLHAANDYAIVTIT
jgi:hypothetical protein